MGSRGRAAPWLLSLVVALGALSCASKVGNPTAAAPALVEGVVEARWRVVEADRQGDERRTLGFVARTCYPLPDGDVSLWLVENDRLQEVGFLDGNGRVFRSLPFSDDPRWVATATLEEGVRILLRSNALVKLERLDENWEEAAFSRPGAR